MSDLSTAANKAREWTEKRDALIRTRRGEGVSLREIGDEAGLSHTAIAKILGRDFSQTALDVVREATERD